jgi:paraquat-inducible protein A
VVARGGAVTQAPAAPAPAVGAGPRRAARTGLEMGLVACERCRTISRLGRRDVDARCPRCGGPVALRKPDSLARSSALLAAAAILYVPANLLPVMTTTTILSSESDTIMSGVLVLIHSGSWPLGALVFLASIVVPLMKLLSLSLLIFVAARGAMRTPLQATRLYRLIEFIGRWSMLDVYAVTLLVGLVQIQSLATIQPGGGIVAFGAVVVLTMLSAQCFDPRLLWDAQERRAPTAAGEHVEPA